MSEMNRREFAVAGLAMCVVGPAVAAAAPAKRWDHTMLKEAWAITEGKDEAGMYEALTRRFGPFPIMFGGHNTDLGREVEVGIFGVYHYPPDFDRRGWPRLASQGRARSAQVEHRSQFRSHGTWLRIDQGQGLGASPRHPWSRPCWSWLMIVQAEQCVQTSSWLINTSAWTVTGSSGGQRFGRLREVLGAALSAVPFSEWPRRDCFETKRPGARSAGNARPLRCPRSRRGPPTESNCRTGP